LANFLTAKAYPPLDANRRGKSRKRGFQSYSLAVYSFIGSPNGYHKTFSKLNIHQRNEKRFKLPIYHFTQAAHWFICRYNAPEYFPARQA
jgi:hypothetical protein